MVDESFMNFIKDTVISKINIDSRLIPSFKRVMEKIQNYFNDKGYVKDRNYQEYLEKYLINSKENNLKIEVKEITKKGVLGFYQKSQNRICINNTTLNSDDLDATLCHEFIHFLVMHGLTKDNSDPEISQPGFINEALTEMLTRQMYPNSKGYDAQVAMQEYANILSNKVNNYNKFLKGVADARYASSDWLNYVSSANAFQKDFKEQGYIDLLEAQNNENYLKAQRYLINLFLKLNSSKNFALYVDCLDKLLSRPAIDDDYINQFIEKIDQNFLKQFNINDNRVTNFLIHKLKEVKELIKETKKEPEYEFTFAGRKLSLDEKMNLKGNIININRQWSPKDKILKLSLNDEKLVLNIADINFNLKKEQIQNKIKELACYFNDNAKKDYQMLDHLFEEPQNIIKVEKFILPNINDTKKTPPAIYLAFYPEKIVVLNNHNRLTEVENVPANKFIGVTSLNPQTGLTYSKSMDNIKNGVLYSALSPKQLDIKVINYYAKKLKETLSKEEIATAIVKYQASDEFILDTEEEITNDALLFLAKEKFHSLNTTQQQQLRNRVIVNNERYIISNQDKDVNIYLLNGNQAYLADKQVLYDKKDLGIYNELIENLLANPKQQGDLKSKLEEQKKELYEKKLEQESLIQNNEQSHRNI